MKIVLQRVRSASVAVDDQAVGQIKQGFLLLVAVKDSDTQNDLDYLCRKVLNLRVFEDEEGKMNRSIQDVEGEILSVSQFTLYAQTRKGNRPSFTDAGKPEFAKVMYQKFNQQLAASGLTVATGIFGADMQINLVNDGPVTIILDTETD